MRKKIILFLLTSILAISFLNLTSNAKVEIEQPYRNYIYNQWNESVPIPNAYEPISQITGVGLGIKGFSDPEDMYIDKENKLIYLLDTKNLRIVVTDLDFNLQYIIANIILDERWDVEPKTPMDTKYYEPRVMNNPKGIFVHETGIYIADTENNRVLVLDRELQEFYPIHDELYVKDGKNNLITSTQYDIFNDKTSSDLKRLAKVKTIIKKPDTTSIIKKSYEFKPNKIQVNDKGIVYILLDTFLEGAFVFEQPTVINGEYKFINLFGSNSVIPDGQILWNAFWKNIYTDEQRERMSRAVPQSIRNIDLDSEGFLYTLTETTTNLNDHVRKINIENNNILKNKRTIGGARFGDYEIYYGDSTTHNNKFMAIDVNDKGLITIADFQYKRLFQYDQESNLLFIFGGQGNQMGLFQDPRDVESYIDEENNINRIYVLDRIKKSITYFETTEFGSTVIDAITYHQKGEYQIALEKWEKVKKFSMSYDLAYVGIGKAKYQLYEYEEAMHNFKLGSDRASYTEVYKDFRKDYVREHFLLILLILAAIYFVIKYSLKYRDEILLFIFRNEDLVSKIKYPFYIMTHPIRGFNELLHYKKGSILVANFMLAALFFTQIFARQKAGFIFNYNNLDELNAFYILTGTVILVVLWCVSNWAFCTLANGKGKFKDIYITTVYSLLPLILLGILEVILSNILTADEGIILYYIGMLKNIWFGILLTYANMIIHHYTLKRTIFSMIITVIGVSLTVFVGVLLFGLFQQLVMFLNTVINEILFRI